MQGATVPTEQQDEFVMHAVPRYRNTKMQGERGEQLPPRASLAAHLRPGGTHHELQLQSAWIQYTVWVSSSFWKVLHLAV